MAVCDLVPRQRQTQYREYLCILNINRLALFATGRPGFGKEIQMNIEILSPNSSTASPQIPVPGQNS